MKKLLSAALLALAVILPGHAPAQVAQAYQATVNNRVTVVPVTAGNPLPTTCISGCASPVGFTPGGGATLAVTTTTARVALPTADPTVLLTNNGSTDLAFKLGNSSVTAATTDIPLQAGRSIVVAAGSATHVAAITASSTSSLSITTGTGTPVISGGGGGGGGGGGAVTVADGADVAQGVTTDAACASDNGNCTQTALLKRNNQRATSIITALGSPFQAGGSIGNTTFASTQSGTWTVQPGNTANTTAWLIDARGNVASGATDCGNPVKVGCVYRSAGTPTLTDGQRGDCQMTARAETIIAIGSSGSVAPIAASGDGQATSNGLVVAARPQTYNGSTYDRIKSVLAGQDTTGTGIQAVGVQAQVDETSTTTVTENQFGNLRMDANRQLRVVDGSTTATYSAGAYDGTNNKNPAGFAQAVADAAISANPTKIKAAPSATSTDGITPIASTAAEACHVMKASGGNLYSASGYIGAAGFIMVFNATSAPADGAVTPVAWLYAAAAGSWSLNYGLMPAVFSTGITICASSTGPLTKTAYSTNTVFSGNVQ